MLIHLSFHHSSSAHARPLSTFLPQQTGFATSILATLGVVCKCCDGGEGEEGCVTVWSGSCSKLQCLPWKLQ
nr:Fibropellin-1 like [Ipomoea batatas]